MTWQQRKPITWHDRYKAAHLLYHANKYPVVYKDGLYSFTGLPTGKPSNRLTKALCNYLEWMGHDANRIDTKGTAKVDKNHAPKFNLFTGAIQTSEKVKFLPTQTKKGSADVEAKLTHYNHPFGVPWSIEVKIRDKQRPDQAKREVSLKEKGLWYDIVHDMDEFFSAYDKKQLLLQRDDVPYRVIIAGTRTFDDLVLASNTADRILENKQCVEIIDGGATGADQLGYIYSLLRGHCCKRFDADWDAHGKSAGPIRNRQMAEYTDAAIIFWDGKSPGSKNMIDEMERAGKPYRVVRY